MTIFKKIQARASEFTAGLNAGFDSLTGEVLSTTLTLGQEHKFFFKYLAYYTETNNKLSSEQKLELLTEYKAIILNSYGINELSRTQLKTVETLYKNKIEITDIAESINAPADLVEIYLYLLNIIPIQRYKSWSKEDIEKLKAYDWSNPNRKLFNQIAKDLQRTNYAVVIAAKKHGLYSAPKAEDKIKANIDQGLPPNAGLKWQEQENEFIKELEWKDISVEKIQLIADELGRTFGSIIGRAATFNLIDQDQRIMLTETFKKKNLNNI